MLVHACAVSLSPRQDKALLLMTWKPLARPSRLIYERSFEGTQPCYLSRPGALRAARDPVERRSNSDGGLLRFIAETGIRGVVATITMAVNVTLQACSVQRFASCNVQRPARGTGDKRIQQSCKNGTRPCLRVAGGRRSDAVRRARSDRERETHSNAQKKLTPRRAHTYHHAGSSASRSGTRLMSATTSTTRSSRMRWTTPC